MGRPFEKLNALQVSRLMKKPGFHGDGRGLYLCASESGACSWIFRYMMNGRQRDMGLGSAHDVSLAIARDKAAAARRLKTDGVDPLDARDAEAAEAQLIAARALSFKEAAAKYMAAHKVGWKNAKHEAQWEATLRTYAYPVIGDISIGKVDVTLVMKVLDPIWSIKPETASRLRGRIEVVLDWAAARNFRTGENPARWRGHLDKILPPRQKVRKIVHHAALPYAEVPALMARLTALDADSPRALRFTILTAARTAEAIGATWGEIDLEQRTWTIPGDRMKAGREHRVPLSAEAMDILQAQKRATGGAGYVFPGRFDKQPMSNMAMLQTLRRLDLGDLTVHGFRSAFRDWAAETTNFPREAAEAALAHAIGDKVEAAYRRGDLFEKRRRLMAAWGAHCTSQKGAKIIPINASVTA